jgi:serine phosphatase RsbU (regulator of sigma subunit)
MPDPSRRPDAEDDDTRTVFVTTQRTVAMASRADWVHYVLVADGPERGLRVPLGTAPLRIGRRAPCEVVLGDAEVSAQHCEVRLAEGGLDAIVSDLGSTNGSYLDGQRINRPTRWPPGAALQVGRHVLKHEHRPQREVQRSAEIDRDLRQASRYLQSLLPPPVIDGPVRADWVFVPSAQIGGDAFSYGWLDERRFAIAFFDVCGHGIAAAVHSVAVLSALRQRTLPGVDFADPAQVMAGLNDAFPMDAHAGMYFTAWGGVYDRATRQLRYASAGHHPAYLVDGARRSMQALATRNPMIGAMRPERFATAGVDVPPGASLHLFSDGVFEVRGSDGVQRGLDHFTPSLLEPALPGSTEPQRLLDQVRRACGGAEFDDDVSLLTLSFLA